MSTAEELVRRAADRVPGGARTFVRAVALLGEYGSAMKAREHIPASWSDAKLLEHWTTKAAVPAIGTSSGLVTPPGGTEFVELVRPQTVIGQLALRRVPFSANAALMTAGAVYAWVGEGAPLPLGQLALTDASLPPRKAGTIIALSKELLRLAAPGSEDVVRSELVNGLVKFSDEQFLDPAITEITSVRPASITNGVTPTASTGNAAEDLRALLAGFARPDNVVIIAGTLQAIALASTFQGGIQNGRLGGIVPIMVSDAAGDYLVAIDPTQILYADDGQVQVAVSEHTSLQFENVPVDAATALISLWQGNLVALKVLRWMNWQRASDGAVALISGASYPAAP